MTLPVIQLLLGFSQSLVDLVLHIVTVETLNIVHFVHSHSPVESNQKRLEPTLPSFHSQVHHSGPSQNRQESAFHHPMEIIGPDCKGKHSHGS